MLTSDRAVGRIGTINGFKMDEEVFRTGRVNGKRLMLFVFKNMNDENLWTSRIHKAQFTDDSNFYERYRTTHAAFIEVYNRLYSEGIAVTPNFDPNAVQDMCVDIRNLDLGKHARVIEVYTEYCNKSLYPLQDLQGPFVYKQTKPKQTVKTLKFSSYDLSNLTMPSFTAGF